MTKKTPTSTQKTVRRSLAIATALTMIMTAGPAAAAGAPDKTTTQFFADGSPAGGTSKMWVGAHDLSIMMHAANLEAGHAYTIWWVVFNNPTACTDHSEGFRCGFNDLFVEAVQASAYWATGEIAKSNGKATFRATTTEGEVPTGPGQHLFGPGLTDASAADVHLVVRGHGPASPDPAMRHDQLTTFGACNPDCIDVQFAVHEPSL